jgi:uncharacterized protein YggE
MTNGTPSTHKGSFITWLVLGVVTIVFAIVIVVIATNQPRSGGITTDKGGVLEGLDSFGEGRVSATPDKTEIVLGVDSRAAEPSAAAIDNNTKTAKILEAVRGLGVGEKDIQTVSVSLYPEYNYGTEPVETPKVSGYLASNTVRIVSRDIAQVGPVIDAAIAAGATNVQGVTFGFTDETRRELENEARRIATDDALRRATALAQFSGVRLGEPISIVETSSGSVPPPIYYAQELGGGPVTADTQIQAGSLEIVLTVNVTYEIE